MKKNILKKNLIFFLDFLQNPENHLIVNYIQILLRLVLRCIILLLSCQIFHQGTNLSQSVLINRIINELSLSFSGYHACSSEDSQVL